MNVLITGGCGYLGTRTAIEMANVGHEVTILDVKPKPAGWELYGPSNITFVQGNILEPKELHEASEGNEVFIHMAFVVGGPSCIEDPDYASNLALTGTDNLISVAGEKRIIFPSTDAVYGNKASGLIREDFPCEPAEIYGQLKLKVEQKIMGCACFDILRLPTNFGVSPVMRHNLLVHYIVRELFQKKHVNIHQPEITRSILEVGDGANAITFLLGQEPTNLVMNVLTESPTKLQIAEEAARILGGTVEIENISSGDPDKRNFVLNTSRINAHGWKPTHSLTSGIESLKKYLEVMSF